jgi:beta-phosphoglucomutase-like phosphatase (HAD superfamily)
MVNIAGFLECLGDVSDRRDRVARGTCWQSADDRGVRGRGWRRQFRRPGVVLSYEVGVVKPDPEIFRRATNLLGLSAEQTLMVGDSWRDDAGAAAIGIRTLILPRTIGPVHGLASVLRLVG